MSEMRPTLTEQAANVQSTEYVVSVLPEECIDQSVWSLTVAYRGAGRWAVLRGRAWVLSRAGNWDADPGSDGRTDVWLQQHRFDEHTALELAIQPALVGLTERHMLDMLRKRYTYRYGNGERYVCAEHVRSHAGFDARRTADFVAMDLWPSKGFSLHGHEVKVSRSDWLTELKDPEKAAEFIPYMTYWWAVVAEPSIVKPGELPQGWGLLAVRGGRLARIHQAAKNHHVRPLETTRIAALLRAVAKTAVRP